MGNKRSCQKQLRVQMKYVPAPDAQERLSRVVNILLKAATRHAATLGGRVNAKKEEPSGQAAAEDAPTGGSKKDDSRESG